VKHSLPITAYTRLQAPCYDVGMTSRDTDSQSESCVVATDAAVAMVTADKIGSWLEQDVIMNSHQLVTDDAFVYEGDATNATSSGHLAASSAMLDATSADMTTASDVGCGDVSRVLPRPPRVTGLAHPAGRVDVTSATRGYAAASSDAAVGEHTTSSRRPPRFRTAR